MLSKTIPTLWHPGRLGCSLRSILLPRHCPAGCGRPFSASRSGLTDGTFRDLLTTFNGYSPPPPPTIFPFSYHPVYFLSSKKSDGTNPNLDKHLHPSIHPSVPQIGIGISCIPGTAVGAGDSATSHKAPAYSLAHQTRKRACESMHTVGVRPQRAPGTDAWEGANAIRAAGGRGLDRMASGPLPITSNYLGGSIPGSLALPGDAGSAVS